jgi:hypothetical protein
MSIDKRSYHRIVTDIPCRFGRELKMYHRQVNISAGGAAFAVMSEMSDHFTQGEKVSFAFELNQRHFQFHAYVVRRCEKNNQTMTAIQFCELELTTQKMLDHIILSMGGYQRDDHEKKNEYLAFYAPNTQHPNHIKTNINTDQNILTAKENAIENHDKNEDDVLTKLDDLFKEFDY